MNGDLIGHDRKRGADGKRNAIEQEASLHTRRERPEILPDIFDARELKLELLIILSVAGDALPSAVRVCEGDGSFSEGLEL